MTPVCVHNVGGTPEYVSDGSLAFDLASGGIKIVIRPVVSVYRIRVLKSADARKISEIFFCLLDKSESGHFGFEIIKARRNNNDSVVVRDLFGKQGIIVDAGADVLTFRAAGFFHLDEIKSEICVLGRELDPVGPYGRPILKL